jgi:hypothetical protein
MGTSVPNSSGLALGQVIQFKLKVFLPRQTIFEPFVIGTARAPMSARAALINRKGVEDLSATMILLAVHNR